MTTRGSWIALGLWCALGSALLGCYDHGAQSMDGQSHWLRECTSANACDDGELCACGVCTRPCTTSSACGAESRCLEVADEGPRCEDARASAGKVCLASCERNEDCGDDGLSCAAHVCVGAAAGVVRDGGEPQIDSQLDPPTRAPDPPRSVPDSGTGRDGGPDGDSGTGRDGGTIDTVDGPLSCAEATKRARSLANDSAPFDECATELDCVSALAETDCEKNVCGVAIAASGAAEFASALEAISKDYCSDFSELCGDPAHIACEPAVPICEQGHCRLTLRTACSVGCDASTICHIDGTCIERGAEDENGVATLAIAAEPHDPDNIYRFGITGFVIVNDTLIWQDEGTYDGAGNHNGDGAIYSMPLAGGAIDLLAGEIGRGASALRVDASRVYYTSDDGIWAVQLDPLAEPKHLVARAESTAGDWTLGGDHVYYVAQATDTVLRRVRTDGSGDEPFFDAGTQLHRLAADVTHVFAELLDAPAFSTRLVKLEQTSGNMSVLVDRLRDDHDTGPLLIDNGLLIADGDDHAALRGYAVDDGELVNVALGFWLEQRWASDGQVYYWENMYLPNSGNERNSVMRAPLSSPFTPVLVRTTRAAVGHIAADGGFLYWVERGRLLRASLPPQ